MFINFQCIFDSVTKYPQDRIPDKTIFFCKQSEVFIQEFILLPVINPILPTEYNTLSTPYYETARNLADYDSNNSSKLSKREVMSSEKNII